MPWEVILHWHFTEINPKTNTNNKTKKKEEKHFGTCSFQPKHYFTRIFLSISWKEADFTCVFCIGNIHLSFTIEITVLVMFSGHDSRNTS